MMQDTLQRTTKTKAAVQKDPIALQTHTLANGLKLFLTVNKEKPRIFTEIAVRAGSKHDPAETTGLAHYFEHMMFKGTDKLGSLDWEKEKPILDAILQAFEDHRKETDPAKKKALYAEIDRLSSEAARYVAANEYDRLAQSIGADQTNAYTWVEQTVYVNDIPSNELDRWFALESERFRRPILRLFHTELETVFEEYNMSQDKDFRKVYQVINEILMPSHPYGTQTTLGRGEDLKNPSQKNIYDFFDRYYVPNNMAIVLSGDFEPEAAIAAAEKHFGQFKARQVPAFHAEAQPELKTRVRKDVYGQEAEWIELAWRFGGANSSEIPALTLLSSLLYNGKAGLFDLNLLQKQQVLEAYAYLRKMEDYSTFHLYAKPRQGQTLEELEQILLEELEKVKNGDFAAWMPEAIIKDLKSSEFRAFETNKGRASALTTAFVTGQTWEYVCGKWDRMKKIGVEQLQNFAKTHFRKDNYVVIYKHQGADKNVMKVEKPSITPVQLNRDDLSGFGNKFVEQIPEGIQPEFVDFKKELKRTKIQGNQPLFVVEKPKSPLFKLFYVYEMGKKSDPMLNLAANYLPYLGTSKHTAEEFAQLLFRNGLSIVATCQDSRLFIQLYGLAESFQQGLELLETLLADAQPNAAARDNLVEDILKQRENAKTDKQTILGRAMQNYALYGSDSPFTNRLSADQLKSISPEELTERLKSLRNYAHQVFYSGPLSLRKAANILRPGHFVPEKPLAPIPEKKFVALPTRKDEVLFVHFPMVQVELLMVSKGKSKFSLEEHIFGEWHGTYFGYGLSSIVFQEIRESMALAYSAYAYTASPDRKDKPHFLKCFVGTQPDKLEQAVHAFQRILKEMPVSPQQLESARQSVLLKISADRLKEDKLYWAWRNNQALGIQGDLRKIIFDRINQATSEDLTKFHQENIATRKYKWLVLGDRKAVDFKFLKKIGRVREMTMEEVFGY